MMNFFMLRKCLGLADDNDGVNANVRVNFACCGGIVRETDIKNEQEKEEEQASKQQQKTERQREQIEENLLRPRSSRRSRISSCFSCCCKGVANESKGMAPETADIHPSSPSTKTL